MADFYKKDKKETFQEVIWKSLGNLREKAGIEYRTPQKKLIVHANWTETILEGDSRKEFCQLVEFLTDILSQEFSDEGYKKYSDIVKEVRTQRDKVNKKEMDSEDFIINKVDLMRKLLRLTMKELKDKEYFKGFGSVSIEEYQDEGD